MSPTKRTARGVRLEIAASPGPAATPRHARSAPINFTPPPARPNAVARETALSLLDRCPPGATALVCAGAGFGKSTLLAQWAARQGAETVWFGLDEAHNDPRRCLADLRTAIARFRPELDVDKASAFLTGADAVELILSALAGGDAVCLVLDDLHVLGDGESTQWLGRLAEHLPATTRLAVGSRTEPPWPLHRLRAGGRLVELRGDLLRFSNAEAHQFLGKTLGLDLPSNAEETLAARTEGWPAGLQLAALALHGRDPRDAAATFTGEHRFVLDYLTSEVLEGL
ncbi:MAG: hypothetical protein KC457_33425, partial [Myxococcales bacterium]|nr:hypothetical protein [Myxococcales bacterium]